MAASPSEPKAESFDALRVRGEMRPLVAKPAGAARQLAQVGSWRSSAAGAARQLAQLGSWRSLAAGAARQPARHA